MSTDVASIARGAMALLPAPAPDLGTRLEAFLGFLLESNTGVNLVSRKDTAVHLTRFTRECLFLARLLSEELPRPTEPTAAFRLLDLGTGGGFPGLVLKLALPAVETTLVECTRKKARFLAEACRRLDLQGTEVIWARAEALSARQSSDYRPGMRRHFDWVTAKAIGTLRESLDLAWPFLKPGGEHWTFKGPRYEAEVRACRRRLVQTNCRLCRVERIPGDTESYLLAIRRQPDNSGGVSRETPDPG